jgi:hypothetical protein
LEQPVNSETINAAMISGVLFFINRGMTPNKVFY